MANVIVQLTRGLTVGDTTHTEAELREPTTADFLGASEDGEKVVRTGEGEMELVSSPTLVAVHLLRRTIVRIGEHPGPLSLGELKRLWVGDLHALQSAADQLQGASLKPLGKQSTAGGGKPG